MTTKVYVIYDIRYPDIWKYVGITKIALPGRFSRHLSHAKNPTRNSLLYKWIREVGSENVDIRQIHSYATDLQAKLQENLIIDTVTHSSFGGLNTNRNRIALIEIIK